MKRVIISLSWRIFSGKQIPKDEIFRENIFRIFFPSYQTHHFFHSISCQKSYLNEKGFHIQVAVKNLDNFSIPGSEIPSWFTPSEVHFSKHENNEIKAVIIAIVVSVNCAEPDELRDELPVLANVIAKIVRAKRAVFTTNMYLAGVPTTPEDQVYICRYQDYHQLVSFLEDGDVIQVGLGNLPITGIELKKCGIHLVHESDDDYEGNEESLDESQQSVSERLTRFYGASNRESNIFSSNSAQEDGEGEGTHNFFSFLKEIFCALKYLLFRRF